jgi:probable rRNA maturation factor
MYTTKNLAKTPLPKVPFSAIKEKVLGKRYDLSVVFVSGAKIKALNKHYRKKDKITNILSFPLSNREGEIFMNMKKISEEAKKEETPLKTYLAYIFIHGLLHLKGLEHGSTMEVEEKRILAFFKFIKR